MNTTIIIICFVIFIFIMLLFFLQYRNKKRIRKMLREQYGRKPIREYDARDFKHIQQLFECFPPHENKILDDQTWKDLNLAQLYTQVNHAISSVGDEYVYRHLRTQQYMHIDALEEHVHYFETHPKERISMQYAFYMINYGKNMGNDFIKHITDTNAFPAINMMIYIITLIIGISCIALLFINPTIAIGSGTSIAGIFIVWITSFILFSGFMQKIGRYVNSLSMFTSCVQAAKEIVALDDTIFHKELDELKSVLKKVEKKSSIMNMLVDIAMMQNINYGALSFITIYFCLFAFVYKWVTKELYKNRNEIQKLYEMIGYFELCISIGSYRMAIPYYTKPSFTGDVTIDFEDMYHPLINHPISNTKEVAQRFIVTGANASGKSTFAKTVAINAIMAQTFNTCHAKKFKIKPAAIYTAMNIEDNLVTGDSYYMAEIKRLKEFYDAAIDGKGYKMFFIDEILKGTNTTERIAAASTILKHFAHTPSFICLTTHDMELTEILKHYYTDYHFKEMATEKELFYDYKIYDGVTTSSNAIALLKFCQYDTVIVDEAETAVAHYLKTGGWKKLS